MKCELCEKKAISTKPSLCAEHFDAYVLNNVQKTISRFQLFTKQTKLLVAVSGGKDSLGVLDILQRLGYHVKGLFINEGIEHYREHSVVDLELFCTSKNIVVQTVSFQDTYGFTLDDAMKTKKVHACTICGTFRRQLLNRYAQGSDVLVTGHNMDDEAQTILINLARGNTNMLFRQGPLTTNSEFFVQRAKPFYFLSEKHVLLYTLLRDIKTQFGECPYASSSYRVSVRDELNFWEAKHPGTKKNILETYLRLKTASAQKKNFSSLQSCKLCGQPSEEEICKACEFKQLIKNELKEMSLKK